jgi:hypothetical protein
MAVVNRFHYKNIKNYIKCFMKIYYEAELTKQLQRTTFFLRNQQPLRYSRISHDIIEPKSSLTYSKDTLKTCWSRKY